MVQPGTTDERTPASADPLFREVERRRTFAIISHPDAGKTTLTEKLLLYAGAIELAGAVRGRTTSERLVRRVDVSGHQRRDAGVALEDHPDVPGVEFSRDRHS